MKGCYNCQRYEIVTKNGMIKEKCLEGNHILKAFKNCKLVCTEYKGVEKDGKN